MAVQKYTAVFRKSKDWGIGWAEEIPGVNSQGETREELFENFRSALREAIGMNREDARAQAGQ
jgi:predicted RNase H-like HicB family nuclease